MTVDAFRDTLLPGERILWRGRPGQGILFSQHDVLLIPFSLMWGGFAVFWEYQVTARGAAPLFFQLWGLPFVCIGLFMIFGRFLLDAYVRAHMDYAITDRRVLIARARPSPAFKAIGLDLAAAAMELVAAGGGRSTLFFGPRPAVATRGWIGWMPALDAAPKFIAMDDAAALMRLIMSASASSVPGGSTPALYKPSGFEGIPAIQRLRPPRYIPLLVALSIPILLILWNTLFCFGIGGESVYPVRSFATTQASFRLGERVPAVRFGPDDTVMALLILNWPNPSSAAGSHRIEWNWYRDSTFIGRTRACHMRFNVSPFTLWTWRTARVLGGGHFRVDTLIDGKLSGTTQFDVVGPPVNPPAGGSRQGALMPDWLCG